MSPRPCHPANVTAVLGPTNTGKTHLAIERMCAHSSGLMGFPLRLLAREVYDRLVSIKGAAQVALITGEERIEPPHARYFCCTAEAMPSDGGGHAFVALDEAQLGGNRERGHIFTDRLLHARGREETMLLGAATLAPVITSLVPEADITQRPRFSTLTHIGPRKLSRLPPRSAIVAFSAEQVYAVAEMVRRFRGGSAVVMGALSPETRNRQVELFQSGEVDYIVATDAIGMGLNLDLRHVAFASLIKFDGTRQRRLIPAEMAQIAGRAGRHQTDGTFGTISGHQDGGAAEFTAEEIYALEEHSFAPLTALYWRDAQPRFHSLDTLIADLKRAPRENGLARAPEAVDLQVLKRLAEEPFAAHIRGSAAVRRFWNLCSLPDFRQQGAETHARFIARLWQDLRGGYLGTDYVAMRIAQLDNVQGDIHTLQGRIAAIRNWAYICQRPDWVLARDEMAARASAAEAKLSDALHGRLTERFVNRRTAILMKTLGQDPALLPVTLTDDGTLCVEDEPIGRIDGFRFTVDKAANHADRKMLLSAAEKALPRILGEKARALADGGLDRLTIAQAGIWHDGQKIASIALEGGITQAKAIPAKELSSLSDRDRGALISALETWLHGQLVVLGPLAKMEAATRSADAGSQARALLITLIAGHGFVSREKAGLEHLPKEMRPFLRRLGITFGALDIFAPLLLKPAARQLLAALDVDTRPVHAAMTPVIDGTGQLPSAYRRAGQQYVRIDSAEKIIKAGHAARCALDHTTKIRRFRIDPALAISTGLTLDSFEKLLRAAGFRIYPARMVAKGALGPAAPPTWEWRPSRPKRTRKKPVQSGPQTSALHVSGTRSSRATAALKPQDRAETQPVAGNVFSALEGLIR